MKEIMRWMSPGLQIKRWMILFSTGLIILIFGATLIINYQLFGALEDEVLYLLYVWTGSYNYFFLVGTGILLAISGIYIMYVSVRKMVKRFLQLLVPDQKELSKKLISKVELAKGVHVVAIGGGHGLSMLLRGMKKRTSNLSAIVTVADDGGSSGRLREEMDIIAPGDLRNCLVAMAEKESVLEQLFQYRFGGNGELSGHSLGNLFLAALIKEFGSVQFALEAASKVLNIRGKVMPSTPEKIKLRALMADGKIVEGETEIAEYPARIKKITTIPENPIAVGAALEAIRKADIITLGPGSLYTSVLPNLAVGEIMQAIKESKAPCIYICNVMTQSGETEGYTVSDHVQALYEHIGKNIIDCVLINNVLPSEENIEKYAISNSKPVEIDEEKLIEKGIQFVACDLIGKSKGAVHDMDILADKIISIGNLLNSNIKPELLTEYLRRKD